MMRIIFLMVITIKTIYIIPVFDQFHSDESISDGLFPS